MSGSYFSRLRFSLVSGVGLSDKIKLAYLHHLFSFAIRLKPLRHILHSQRVYTIHFRFKKKRLACHLRLQDIPIFFEIWQRETYNTSHILASAIFDIGANIGMTSLYYKTLFPDIPIIAVEPNPSNIDILEKNVGAINTIRIIPKAVTQDGRDILFDTSLVGYNSKISSKGEKLSSVDINSLLSGHSNIFVKMDIEGGEHELLTTNANWLTNITTMIIEIHSTEIKELLFQRAKQYNFDISHKQSKVFMLS